MLVHRPIEHGIMPTFLQAHAGEQDLESGDDIDLYLRVAALHCRKLVIPDSDLNNAELLYAAADHDRGVFWSALRTGFIQRAARVGPDGAPVPPRVIAEGLRMVNPARANRIPIDYLQRIDALCERNEGTTPPPTWSRAEVDKLSLGRLNASFGSAAKLAGSLESHALFDRVWNVVREHQGSDLPFGAADIETEFRPPNHETSQEWDLIWRLAMHAQSGNIPFVFGGQLAITTTPRSADKLLSAGPESTGVETEVESDIYLNRTVGDGRFNIRIDEAPVDPTETPFMIDNDRLRSLRLEEIEEFREEALGGDYFQKRFEAAGSAERMREIDEDYNVSLRDYHERLAQVGLLRNARAERAAIEETLRRVVVVAEKHDEIVELLMQTSTARPIGEHNVVMCDTQTVFDLLGPDEARKILPDENALWVYRRPDYRVLERIA
jgi:hypothetical protein